MTATLIDITQPDDLHLHVRTGEPLKSVIHDTAKQFARAIIMPNLATPVTQVKQAQAYRQEIISALAEKDTALSQSFQPLMTLYLTDNTSTETLQQAKASGIIHGVKLYPAGATTHSDAGVTNINNIYPILETLQKLGMPLLIHGEVTAQDVDIYDRERVFIDTILAPLIHHFPDLKIVLEHITTSDAVDFVSQAPASLVATITAHHLLINRNAIFSGGIRPHHYCLPVLKREQHRKALVSAATSGNPKFFLGTDSAPHAQLTKESACGCAGIYTAYNAMELYTEVFDKVDALNKLENFASTFGANFYQLPINKARIHLQRQDWQIPRNLPYGTDKIIPFRAGENCHWKLLT